MVINFCEINFWVDEFLWISRFFVKSAKIYLREIYLILLSAKLKPRYTSAQAFLHGFSFKNESHE